MFGFGVVAPRGKKVQFAIDALKDVDMILESDLTIKADSQFEPLMDFKLTGWKLAAAGIAKGLVEKITKKSQEGFATTKQFGFQQWAGTSPLTMNFSIGLYRKTDAYKDVVQPARIILSLAVPRLNRDGNTLEAPGVTAFDMLSKKGAGVTIYAGPCTIYQCNILSVEPTISQEVDSNGYPLWIKLTVGAATMYTANTGMMYDLFRKLPPSMQKTVGVTADETEIEDIWDQIKNGGKKRPDVSRANQGTPR